jgi:hypothetical protein
MSIVRNVSVVVVAGLIVGCGKSAVEEKKLAYEQATAAYEREKTESERLSDHAAKLIKTYTEMEKQAIQISPLASENPGLVREFQDAASMVKADVAKAIKESNEQGKRTKAALDKVRQLEAGK